MEVKKFSRIAFLAAGGIFFGGAVLLANYMFPRKNSEEEKPVERWTLSEEELEKASLPVFTPSMQRSTANNENKYEIIFKKLNRNLVYLVLEFLEMHEVAGICLVSKKLENIANALIHDGRYIKQCVAMGFPEKLRVNYWSFLTGANVLRKENANLYSTFSGMVPFQSEKWTHVITNDLHRTFPENKYFQDGSSGISSLRNVLVSYSMYASSIQRSRNNYENASEDVNTSYVQGMNFIVGFLLLLSNEETSFWIFHTFMTRYRMDGIFSPLLPRLRLCLHQWSELLCLFLPKLHSHLESEQVGHTMYASEWFLTLFCYRLPHEACVLIWDHFVVDGIIAIHKVGLAVLSLMEERLLLLPFDMLLRELKIMSELSTENMPQLLNIMKNNLSAVDNDLLNNLDPLTNYNDPFTEFNYWEMVEN